ncbi:Alpha-1,4-glucan:maltose-1-phosphate maltosyltransferase [Actinobacteria bacterium OK074]|nr:Alpha-1,4-glucan:maltose-1-phosphate maltosyltransferase [Actinobacteria bacterium OK074]
MARRLVVDDEQPVVSRGRYPAKAVVGERLPVRACVWREGHDAVAATLVLHGPDGGGSSLRMALEDPGEDRWVAWVTLPREGMWTYRVDAWSDPWSTWRGGLLAHLEAGRTAGELANELETGARLVDRHVRRVSGRPARDRLRAAAAALRDPALDLRDRTEQVLSGATARLVAANPVRELLTRGSTHRIWADPARALFGAWYEFFPRSTGGVDQAGRAVHGTFATAAAELPRIAAMGFDVVYLPPVHPVGRVHRKGANNTLTAGARDVGSPWGIGAREGGHDAVHPDLGTLDDFDDFVRTAAGLGLDVALDLAFQCAPDHPWSQEHPEWFHHRPDGTVAHAQNPPKSYEDIQPLNFDGDRDGLYAELLRIVLFWIGHGVRIFRVDNPHTKPADFWHWLIWKVKNDHPDVLFLAEAFTRPAILKGLAKLGFTQSYTYFTWRNTKQELTEYAVELAASADFLRPNLFVNTPDILQSELHGAGPEVFAMRATLAATLSPTWGLYAGFELGENRPLHEGSEEYLDSEKYQLRPRDFAAATAQEDGLPSWIARLNDLRRRRPALQQLRNVTFHDVDNDRLVAYTKSDPARGDHVLCVVSLDPARPQEGTVLLDTADPAPQAWDELAGETVLLDGPYTVKIDPGIAAARILTWSTRESNHG